MTSREESLKKNESWSWIYKIYVKPFIELFSPIFTVITIYIASSAYKVSQEYNQLVINQNIEEQVIKINDSYFSNQEHVINIQSKLKALSNLFKNEADKIANFDNNALSRIVDIREFILEDRSLNASLNKFILEMRIFIKKHSLSRELNEKGEELIKISLDLNRLSGNLVSLLLEIEKQKNYEYLSKFETIANDILKVIEELDHQYRMFENQAIDRLYIIEKNEKTNDKTIHNGRPFEPFRRRASALPTLGIARLF